MSKENETLEGEGPTSNNSSHYRINRTTTNRIFNIFRPWKRIQITVKEEIFTDDRSAFMAALNDFNTKTMSNYQFNLGGINNQFNGDVNSFYTGNSIRQTTEVTSVAGSETSSENKR